MQTANNFYSTYTDENEKNQFDLEELGVETWRGFAAMIFDSRSTILSGGEQFNSPTNSEDYDKIFYNRIFEIKPVYQIEDFYDYHFNKYKNRPDTQPDLFIKHIEYVILPLIEYTERRDYIRVTENWIKTKKTMILKKQEEEKNKFLKTAYEVANKNCPSAPLTTNINPLMLGDSIGFDKTTTKRIMNELVGDGYAKSSLGMSSLFVTKEGLNYLKSLEADFKVTNQNYIDVKDGSTVQIQNNSNTINSQQIIELKENNIDELKKFVEEIKMNFNELNKDLGEIVFESFKTDLACLEKNLNRPKANKEVIKTLTGDVVDILKSVSSDLISSIIIKYFNNPF